MTDRNDDLIPKAQPTGEDAIRARQHSRAVVMALLLGAFVVLVFAISIVKIQMANG